MAQELRLCGNCGRPTMHQIHVKGQNVSILNETVFECTICKNQITLYLSNEIFKEKSLLLTKMFS